VVSRRGREIAERLVDRYLRESGVLGKSAGTRDRLIAGILADAEYAARLEKASARKETQLEQLRERIAQQEELLDHHRTYLPAVEALAVPPPLPQLRPGTTAAFVPDEWEVSRRVAGMVDRQMKAMNVVNHVNGHGPDET
jgi:hypothetical protein